MRNLQRLFPFIWPYRARIAWSVLFALLVAVLWGANLTVVFPVVKVLVQQENLHDWIDEEIAETQARIEQSEVRIGRLEPDRIDRRARSHGRLTAEHQRLALLNWTRDRILPWVPDDRFQVIALVMAMLFVATLVKGLCVAMQTVLIGSVVELSSMRIRKACFRRCLKLDYQSLNTLGSTELMSRMTNDVSQLASGLQVFGVRLIREPLKAAICIALAFAWNWRLTLLAMVFAPVIAVVISWCGKLLKRASRRSLESVAGICSVVSESFRHVRLVIAFEGGRRHRQMFHRENKSLYRHSMSAVRVGSLISPMNEFLGVLAAMAALLPAMYMVFRGTTEVWGIRLASAPMEPADVALLYAFLAGTLDPIHKLSGIYGQYKKAAAAADRVFDLLERETAVPPPPRAVQLGRLKESVTFDQVSFAYANTDTPRGLALSEVSIRINAGEVVAVVGGNGCGKSTLVNLMLRFADPLSGSVSIDGTDLRRLKPAELRSGIGLVMQETLLFDASVYDNIRYGDFSADEARIRAAADIAHVTPFLEQLPDGIHTQIGHNGSRLSGGQRQRIALARALVRDPGILILDEATSAIDSHSESLIFESLRQCCVGRTVIVIAHSLSETMLDLVDRVVVMKEGHVAAEGRHEELLADCDEYSGLNKAHHQQRKAG